MLNVTIQPPQGFDTRILGAEPSPRRRRGRGAAAVAPPDDVLAALAEQDLEVARTIELTPTAPRVRRRRSDGRPPAPEPGRILVELEPDEEAVVLLEQGGMYTWSFGQEAARPAAPRRRRGAEPARTVEFDIELRPDVGRAAGPRRRGPVSRFIIGRATAYVLRFVAREAARRGMAALESKVRTGLVHITDPDVSTWQPVDPSALTVPQDRPASVLLLVHGTFSSTAGSFAGLTAGSGQQFLRSALEAYDLVLGFDHRTLSVDPLQNARELLDALDGVPWPEPPEIDALAFSRGGLVVRSLTETLLPTQPRAPHLSRVVFVACTNGGTQFASPDNWKALIDVYTTIAVAAARMLALLPNAAPAAPIIAGAIRGVAALARHMAMHAVGDDSGVPGLAAMRPDGAFVAALNGTQPGQPSPDETYYCAVTSDFDPAAPLVDGSAIELPPALLVMLGDGLVDRLMNADNDLVVDTASMTAIDPQVGGYIRDVLDFGRNASVFHCNYFYRPEVVAALTRWLGLAAAEVLPRRSVAALPSPLVSDSILLASADALATDARRTLRRADPEWVVITRLYRMEPIHYAFRADEVRRAVRGAGPRATLLDALDLHETEQSPVAAPTEPLTPRPLIDFRRPWSSRTVVAHMGRPIGVLPAAGELPDIGAVVSAMEAMPELTMAEPPFLDMPTAAAPPDTARPVRRMRGARRGVPPAAGPRRREPATTNGGTETAPQRAPLHCRAEIDDQVVIGRDASVFVTLSREELAAAGAGRMHDDAAASVDTERELLVQVVPRMGFRMGDHEDRATVDVPAPGSPLQLTFDLVPDALGRGEVWVQVRQGPLPLATLKLFTEIVQQRQGATRHLHAVADAAQPNYAPTPVDVLRVAEELRGTELRLTYTVEFRSIGLQRRYESPAIGDRIATYMAARYGEIEERYAANRNDALAFEADLRGIGARLFRDLMPVELQRVLWQNRDRLSSVQVYSTEPHVPWELVYVRDPDARGAGAKGIFLGELGLVRWLYEGFPAGHLRARPRRVKYIIPVYELEDDVLEGAEREATWLKKQLRAVAVQPISAKVYDELREPGRFDVLHIACHGLADATDIDSTRLKMQGRFDGDDYVEDWLLATTIENEADLIGPGDERPLIVVNACQTGRLGHSLSGIGGFAPAFIRNGAGAFVGAHWSIGDDLAFTFVQALYTALREGRPLAEATRLARSAARDAKDPTWLAYTVYGEPGARIIAE